MSQQQVSNAKNALSDFKAILVAQRSDWSAALPPQITPARFEQTVLTAVMGNPDLLQCTPRSLWNAAKRAALDGLMPDGKQGAMVVRLNSKTQKKEAHWQVMVAGLRIKARNSGEVVDWYCHTIHAKDQFEYALGDDPFIRHVPALGDRGALIGAYSVAKLDGGEHGVLIAREVMSIAEIHEIRDRFSDAWKSFKNGKIKSTPWSTSEGEMAKKTVARRHAKVLPLSETMMDFVSRMDEPNTDADTDAKAGPVPDRPLLTDFEDISVDEDTGEVIENEKPAKTKKAEPETKPAEEQKTSDAVEPLPEVGPPEALELGRKARDEGRALRAVPPEWRTEESASLAEAWQSGWRARDDEITAEAKSQPAKK